MNALVVWGVIYNTHRVLFVMATFPVMWLALVWTSDWRCFQIAVLVIFLTGIFIAARMIE
jgi:hypothetical protein